MGQSIFERIQAKIELFRLEQRYTRRRHRRSTFVSNAIYVDGEYIYNTPNSTGSSSTSTNASSTNASQSTVAYSSTATASRAQKKLNRFSSMPGFGSMTSKNSPSPPVISEADWRVARNSFDGTRR